MAIARFLPGLVSLYDLSFPDGRHLVTSSLAAVGPNAAAIRALHIGHTVVALPRFSVKSLLGAIQAHRITSLHAVPTLLEIALGFPEDMRSAVDVSSLRSIVLVGAKCPIDTKRAIVDWWGPIVHEVYSSTEVGMTHISSPEWLARPGSVGRPIAGSHLRIVNEQGGDCPAFTVGRIYMKRDGDTFEYWNDPESTRSAHLGEYVTVGDEGFVDRDGWLYLAGRAIERINSGAIKFYPSEVEDVLLGDPDVIRAAVFGTASRHMGEVVVAIVELDASTTLAAVKSRLFERCRARLARPKWPVRILSATLPTLPSGKVDRLQTRRLISPDSDTTIDPPATGG